MLAQPGLASPTGSPATTDRRTFAMIEAEAEASASAALEKARRRVTEARARASAQDELIALRDIVFLEDSTCEVLTPELVRGIELATGLHDQETLDFLTFHKGSALACRGQPVEGARLMAYALTDAEERKFDQVLARLYWSQAVYSVRNSQGTDEAAGWALKAFNLFERMGDRLGMAAALQTRAYALRAPVDASADDLELAVKLDEQALALHSGHGSADVELDLGLSYYRQHKYDEAAEIWKHAKGLGSASRGTANILDFRIGDVELARGRLRIARAQFTKVIESNEADAVTLAHTLERLAVLESREGNRTAAIAALVRARSVLDPKAVPRLEIDDHAAAAEMYATLGDYKQAFDEQAAGLAVERAATAATNKKAFAALKLKSSLELKERENALLVAREADSRVRRANLLLGLSLAIAMTLLMAGVAVLVQLRSRARTRAHALTERLSSVGREVTATLQLPLVAQRLDEALRAEAGAASSALWLVDGELVNGESHGALLDAALATLARRCVNEGVDLLERAPADAAATWLLGVPLGNAGGFMGALCVLFKSQTSPSPRLRQVAHALSIYATAALANVRNAHELGRVEAALASEKAQNMVAHAAKMVTIGALASGIVHEMSHPVTSMMLQGDNAAATLKRDATADLGPALASILRETHRLARLVGRLRDFTRVDVPRIMSVDLQAVVADAHALFEPRLRMERVACELNLRSLVVRADPERLSLVIANIAINAMDAMRESRDRNLFIDSETDGERAWIRIRDTGPGLTRDQLDHLFEPFFTTKPAGQGVGLGLSLSMQTLHSMQGTLTAANDLQGGAVFTLSVPLAG
jgi:C4-dicarboxylate-specific signal transduction histidine kinase